MKSIIDSIYSEPEKWHLGKYNFVRDNGPIVWIANGFWFYSLYGLGGSSFTLIERVRFKFALKWWIRNAPFEKLACR